MSHDFSAMPKGQALAKYTVDVTKRAKEGKLDPVIGRDDVSSSFATQRSPCLSLILNGSTAWLVVRRWL